MHTNYRLTHRRLAVLPYYQLPGQKSYVDRSSSSYYLNLRLVKRRHPSRLKLNKIAKTAPRMTTMKPLTSKVIAKNRERRPVLKLRSERRVKGMPKRNLPQFLLNLQKKRRLKKKPLQVERRLQKRSLQVPRNQHERYQRFLQSV